MHKLPLLCHGVATVRRIDKITGLFCEIHSLLKGSFAKETYHFIDLTNTSHPIMPNRVFIQKTIY